jgi:hypothetical protein
MKYIIGIPKNMNQTNFTNIGHCDMEFVQIVKEKFGNLHGLLWNRNENSDLIGWYWTVDNDDTNETNHRIYETYIQYMAEAGIEIDVIKFKRST